jgi:flagellar biosynthesis/type III secretory pathway protein FliH
MKGLIICLIIGFAIGYYYSKSKTEEKIVYKTKTEYVKDPNAVSKSTLDSEIAKAKNISFNAGYSEGRKIGMDEGYKSGYTQGIEYGKSIILDQIDLRIKEAERTNQNVPLFKVKHN